MSQPRSSTLWLRLAAPLLLFVVAGSIGIALWLHAAARRESRTVFATLARTSADFIRNAKLPANERVAAAMRNWMEAAGRAALESLPEGERPGDTGAMCTTSTMS